MLLLDTQEETQSDTIETRGEIDELFKKSKIKLEPSTKHKFVDSMGITQVKNKETYKSKARKDLGAILEAIDRSTGKKSKRKPNKEIDL